MSVILNGCAAVTPVDTERMSRGRVYLRLRIVLKCSLCDMPGLAELVANLEELVRGWAAYRLGERA